MALLTDELKARFHKLGDQRDEEDPIVVCHMFTPGGSANWFATSYDPEDNTCFGYVQGLSPNPHDDEWGSFSLSELEAVRVPPFGLSIERDLYWEEGRFSQVVQKRHA